MIMKQEKKTRYMGLVYDRRGIDIYGLVTTEEPSLKQAENLAKDALVEMEKHNPRIKSSVKISRHTKRAHSKYVIDTNYGILSIYYETL